MSNGENTINVVIVISAFNHHKEPCLDEYKWLVYPLTSGVSQR